MKMAAQDGLKTAWVRNTGPATKQIESAHVNKAGKAMPAIFLTVIAME